MSISYEHFRIKRQVLQCTGECGWCSESGAPTNQSNTETHRKVCAALIDDRCPTIRMLAKWFHIDKKNHS